MKKIMRSLIIKADVASLYYREYLVGFIVGFIIGALIL
jgi:hypothetical protein